MLLHALRLVSFRAHQDTEVGFAPKVNLLYGPNGAGKTNLLEAIHYLCLTKSFVASQDTYVVRQGAPYFEVEGQFESERRPEFRIRLVYVPESGKRLFINRAPLERISEVIGMLPVVVFSPEDQALTAAGPDERRRFINNIMSQARPVYMDDLYKYRRALKQRNEVLAGFRRRFAAPPQEELLASWDAELALLGSRIVAARQRFIHTFRVFLEEAYHRIEQVAEHPTVEYVTFARLAEDADEAAIREAFLRKMERVRRRERELGRTLVGPHLDELVFRLDEMEVRRYASQGQHRTFGMALKLAQFLFLKDRVEEMPLLLLDDVFGNLDPQRTEVFLNLLQSDLVGQSFITATHREPFDRVVPFEADAHRALRVAEGRVVGDVPV